jgi:hypothetical protein
MGTTTIETLQVQLKADVDDLKKQMDAARKSLGQLELGSKETREELKKLSSEGVRLQNSFGGLKSLFAGLGTAYVGKKLIDVGKSSIQMAMDVVESESLFETSMGGMAAAARKWSDQLSESLGLNAYELRQNVGVMYNMTKSMGIAGDTAYDLSTSLVMLAQDMASFYNMDTEEAFTKLRAGITGETEPLKALGILVDENTIKQYAYKNGLAATGEELTQQQKVLARYYAILDQTSTAQGDLARTIDSPANQLRILKAQLEQTKIELGMGLLPVVQEVMPYLVAFAQKLADIVTGIFGVEKASQSLSGSLGGADYSSITQAAKSEVALGDAIEDTDKKLKKSLTGFDEINKLGTGAESLADQMGLSDADLSFNIPTLSSGIETESIFDNDKLKDAREAIDNICEVIGNLRGVLLALVGYKVIKGFGAIKEGISGLTGTTGKMTKKLIAAGGAVVAFDSTRTAAREFASENTNLATAISSLITGGAGAIAAGLSFGGPLGIAIAAFSVLGGTLAGVSEGLVTMRLTALQTDYYDIQGTKIDDLRDSLNNYFAAMNFDKQAEWIRTIEKSEESYEAAQEKYDEMWNSIADKPELDDSDIENLTDAYNDLAQAAKAVNDAKIGSLMESIRTGIEQNITAELSKRLGDLLGQLEYANILLGKEVSRINSEYQKIIDEISESGTITDAQKSKLQEYRKELSEYTISSDDSKEQWNADINAALQGAIDAGDNKNQVISNVKTLMADRDAYIDTAQKKYAADRNTLVQLIDIDQKKFGGQLGFATDKDNNGEADALELLESTYDAQIREIKSKYNETLDAIINTYSANTVMKSGQSYEQIYDGLMEGLYDYGGKQIMGLFDRDYIARSELAREQTELLNELKSYKISGYATGGFPEDGLFYANSEELVGRFTNGRTAVANNLQILEGIKQAVLEALQTAGGMDGGNWTIQVVDTDGNIKAEQIISAAERRNRRDGRTILPLGD